MIGLWIAVAVIAVILVVLLLLALRPDRALGDRASYDLRVYRDQLDEVARDRDRGLIGDEQAAAATAEIQRRILALADGRQGATGTASPGQRAAVIAVAVAAPLAGIALYLHLGSPAMPDVPFAARSSAPTAQAVEHSQEMLDMVDRLGARLKQSPGDVEGWMLLARSYLTMDRYLEAADAYRSAVERSSRQPELLSAWGEARVMATGGRVDDETLALFDEVMGKTDIDPRAWFYGALGRAQRGQLPQALELWVDLAAVSPPDAPWLADLRQRIDGVAGELGVDPKAQKPSPRAQALIDGAGASPQAAVASPAPPAAAPRGPTREDMEAALGLSPDDRQQMIRGMVAGLAAKLEQNPGDLDGWVRLERAYRVLGETAKADQAAARVAALRAPAPSAPPPAAGPAATPRGPTQQDVEGAAAMTPEQRAEMIQGMVGGLVARLKENPNDLQGWTMLERSYRVLGETAKADEVAKRIEAMQKGN